MAKSNPTTNEHIGSKWETVGLFMALTGALTFFFAGGNSVGIIMTVSGLIVYGAGKFLIGKYI